MHSSFGIDHGTNSVRAFLLNCSNGTELGSCVVDYPSGHQQGVLLDRNNHHLARQNPADYLYGLEKSVRGAIEEAGKSGFSPEMLVGIGVDTTASSQLPVDAQNRALAFDPKREKDLNAQCWLWKDHTSHQEAATITRLAAEHRPHFVAKCGNTSKWFWSKIWRCLKVAPETFEAAYSRVELADWIHSVLAGVSDPRAVRRGVVHGRP